MKTILEYIQKKHIISDTSITVEDICAIFNGDSYAISSISSCSFVTGSFKWKEGITTMVTDGEMIIIYNQEDETSLDPDYIIKIFTGHRRDARVLLSYFYDRVHHNMDVNKHYKCTLNKLENNIPILHFDKTDYTIINSPVDLAIFTKEKYKDLEIEKRIR